MEKEDIKRQILDSALAIARTEGWEKVSTRRIMQKSGRTTIGIYYYLKNKVGILTELQRDGFAMLASLFLKCASDRKNLSWEATFINLSWCFWDFAHTNKEQYELMFGLANISSQGPNSDVIKQAGGVIQALIKEKTQDGVLSIFFNWWALCAGFILISFQSFETDQQRVKESFNDALKRFLKSF